MIGLDGVVGQQENYRKSGFQLAYANVRYGGTVAAPAAQVLRAAYAALPEPDGTITLKVARGEHCLA